MLKNKIVFISGASSGIGAACATSFAKAGAALLLCARRTHALNTLANQLRSDYGIEVHSFELDVRDHFNLKKKFEALPTLWKSVDILINNAGVALGLETLQEGDTEDWETMIDTNIKGLLYLTHAVLPSMILRNTGHIINIGSIAGHQVYPKGAVYCATKHAVKAISQGLRLDLFGTKVRISTVDPGMVETNLSMVRFKGDAQRAAAVYEGVEALSADDIADAIIYCATRPLHVNVNEIIIMPTQQVSATMTYRDIKDKKNS